MFEAITHLSADNQAPLGYLAPLHAPFCSSFKGKLRKDFEALFNQQLWCLGCDIRRSEGNLLIEYGFNRFRAPIDRAGSTRYEIEAPQQRLKLTLWGFGVLLTSEDHGSLQLRRYEVEPRWHAGKISSTSFRAGDVQRLPLPVTPVALREAQLCLKSFCLWAREYEEWICTKTPKNYRDLCLKINKHKRFCKGKEIASQWSLLARRLD